jgi:hypothetical protein
MNGSTENRAYGSFEKGQGQDAVLTWGTAGRMLPLVKSIIEDLAGHHRSLMRLLPEKERLDRRRRNLSWPERSRRYLLQEELAREEQGINNAMAELDSLGLSLIDADYSQVGFPTLVNNRRAFFSWRPGEESIQYWHFADDLDRRSIPMAWTKATETRTKARR